MQASCTALLVRRCKRTPVTRGTVYGMKRAKVIVFPLRLPPASRFCQWQNNLRVEAPRAVRRHSRVQLQRGNVIVMPKRRTRQDGRS
jgi:hypothetical protein